MEFILPLLLGFLASSSTTILPGLLNMTAARISLREGRHNALVFGTGASLVVFIQAYVAVSFAKFLYSRPDIIFLLEEIGVFIFLLLTVYFFFIAKKAKDKDVHKEIIKRKSRTGNFFLGTLLSTLNFFPIPFYVFISISFSAYNYFFFNNVFVFLFVLGAMSGSFFVFYLYAIFFRRFEHKTQFFMRNVNYFIGSITCLIALITLLRIWQSH